MSLLKVIRLIIRHWKVLVAVPTIMAVLVFMLTGNTKPSYSSHMTVYTGLASGYNIESGGNSRIDYFQVNTAFDNLTNVIKARETQEEVALRLLATHLLLEEPDVAIINAESFAHLHTIISDSLYEVLVDPGSFEKTFSQITQYMDKNEFNEVYSLLNSDTEKHYGIAAISEVKVMRLNNSDIIKLSFTSNDAGICKQTLELITDVFSRRFKAIKEGETSNVVHFFEEETKRAQDRLHAAEEELKDFRTSNRVINYNEQTKFISEKREDMMEELNKEKMVGSAAQAALLNIEKKLGNRQKMLLQSDEIIHKRNRLSELTGEIALAQIELDAVYDAKQLADLQREYDRLKQGLSADVADLYTYSRSTEGLDMKKLLNLWLEKALEIDESNARLLIYEQQRQHVEETYDFFAPLGSKISQMERQIAVAEKEYLTALASLNASRLRDQNVSMSSNLKIVDPAFYPFAPEKGKRIVLVIAAFIVGTMLVIALLIATELLDHSIRTPERASSLTKLEICGGIPVEPKKGFDDFQSGILHVLSSQIYSRVTLAREQSDVEGPFVVALTSTRQGEGKTTLCGNLLKGLNDASIKTIAIVPDYEDDSELSDNHLKYKLTPALNGFTNLADFGVEVPKDIEIILLELPAVIDFAPPAALSAIAHQVFLVTRSNRLWNEADERSLLQLERAFEDKPLCVLNALEWYVLESFVGELPKKRGLIRRIVKRVVTLNFNSPTPKVKRRI